MSDEDNRAFVGSSCGRLYLCVGGYIVAMQGDVVRDLDLDGEVWDREKLEKVRDAINAREKRDWEKLGRVAPALREDITDE